MAFGSTPAPQARLRVPDRVIGKPIRTLKKAWSQACIAAGCPVAFRMICGARPFGTWAAQACPSASQCNSPGTRRSVFERYNIVSDGDLGVADGRLSGLMGSKTDQ